LWRLRLKGKRSLMSKIRFLVGEGGLYARQLACLLRKRRTEAER
jgi:hypothetical protein